MKIKVPLIMDFWKWAFMPCVTQLYVNENILQSVKSESAPCIKLLGHILTIQAQGLKRTAQVHLGCVWMHFC